MAGCGAGCGARRSSRSGMGGFRRLGESSWVAERLLIKQGDWSHARTSEVDEETRARAVRLYLDRLRDHNEPKLAARQQVGQLLDTNPKLRLSMKTGAGARANVLLFVGGWSAE